MTVSTVSAKLLEFVTIRSKDRMSSTSQTSQWEGVGRRPGRDLKEDS